eukprot:8055234-Heterocapsa_arctica.AAC.1
MRLPHPCVLQPACGLAIRDLLLEGCRGPLGPPSPINVIREVLCGDVLCELCFHRLLICPGRFLEQPGTFFGGAVLLSGWCLLELLP